jgi:membrane protein implicated in regulation of membrane protease activity
MNPITKLNNSQEPILWLNALAAVFNVLQVVALPVAPWIHIVILVIAHVLAVFASRAQVRPSQNAYAPVAQLEEQGALNAEVVGSIPSGGMHYSKLWTVHGLAGPVDLPTPTDVRVMAPTLKAAAKLGAQVLGPTLEGGTVTKFVGEVWF